MKIIKTKNMEELGQKAADWVIEKINEKPDLMMALPTGNTPTLMYQKLVEANKAGKADFSKVKVFNLDEYYGLSSEHPQSFYQYLFKNFYSKINLNKENIEYLHGDTDDPGAEAQRYHNEIQKAGGFDLVILGIGENGHIAFNEPGSSFESKTRLVDLAPETVKRDSSLGIPILPERALTVGISEILSSKEILLLAGKEKKEIIEKAIKNPVTEKIPASVLQKHQNVTVIIEE